MTVTCPGKSTVCGSNSVCQAEVTPIRFTSFQKAPAQNIP